MPGLRGGGWAAKCGPRLFPLFVYAAWCVSLGGAIGEVHRQQQQCYVHVYAPHNTIQLLRDESPVAHPAARSVPTWQAFHSSIAEAVQQGTDVAFFADSLAPELSSGCVDVWLPMLPEGYSSTVAAVQGDQVGHLLWRLQNGEAANVKPPKVAILGVGMSDLDAGLAALGDARLSEAVPGLADRMDQLVRELLAAWPHTQLMLMGLLPRGASTDATDDPFDLPSPYTEPSHAVNARLKVMADVEDRVTYVDCGPLLLTPDGALNPVMVPNAQQLSPLGLTEVVGSCLRPTLQALLLEVDRSASPYRAMQPAHKLV